MRIAQSTVAMVSKREYRVKQESKESLETWKDPQTSPSQPQNPLLEALMPESSSGKNPVGLQATGSSGSVEEGPSSEEASFSINLKVAEYLLEQATGKKITLKLATLHTHGASVQLPDISGATAGRVGWGLEYQNTQTITERESIGFAASGIIKTADNREISFTAELSMSREFMEQHSITVKAGDPKRKVDPLVINFSGTAPSLTEAKFKFDLDSDGVTDSISFVNAGSGFLTLDVNDNGTIDNGKELFGPSTGSGFAELAAYDDDRNGWIDEGDAVFNQLGIWTKDANGQDHYFTLKEKNIGAIYLDNIKAQFQFNDAQNQSQGLMQTAGVFLRENGTAGTMQQIDLAV